MQVLIKELNLTLVTIILFLKKSLRYENLSYMFLWAIEFCLKNLTNSAASFPSYLIYLLAEMRQLVYIYNGRKRRNLVNKTKTLKNIV